jgi:anti-anti-sigma factor
MKLHVIAEEDHLVQLACEGSITTLPLVGQAKPLEDLLGPQGYSRTVLLDFSRAGYIDSSGISWLILAHKHFMQAGGRLILHSMPARLQSVIDVLGLETVLNLAVDENAARGLVDATT